MLTQSSWASLVSMSATGIDAKKTAAKTEAEPVAVGPGLAHQALDHVAATQRVGHHRSQLASEARPIVAANTAAASGTKS